MRRTLAIGVSLILALSAGPLAGCRRAVKVMTGERVVCTYGEVVSDTIREIEVPEADAGKYVTTTRTITCDRHKRLESLYALVQEALASGDTSSAAKSLTEIVKLDPSYRRSAEQLKQIREGRKPKPDTSASTPSGPGSSPTTSPPSTPGTTPGPSPTPGGPMENYRFLLPDALPGFSVEALAVEELALTRAYVPKDKGRFDQLVIMVEQYQSSAGAKQAIDTRMRPEYGSSGEDVTVAGLSGYTGVNGQGFLILTLDRSGVLVTFELHATGAKAADLKSDLKTIAAGVLK
jgi:hypothetical protein